LLVGGALGVREEVVSGGREVQGVGASIGGVATALDQSAVLEVVDEADHRVAVDAQGIGEPLLGLSLIFREVHEQPEVTWPDPQRRQAGRELVRASGAQLREQETGSVGEQAARCALGGVGHQIKVPAEIVMYYDNHGEGASSVPAARLAQPIAHLGA